MDAQPARLWKPLIFTGIIGLLFVAALILDVGSWLDKAGAWIDSLGPWGPVAYIAVYAVATVLMVPGTIMTALGAALFGAVWGVAYVSVGATLGAAACFLIARYIAAEDVRRWVTRRDRFRHLDQMTERHGAWVVAITRLVPWLPFNALNYALGLTRVGFWTYLFWTWLCILPGTIAYVVGIDAVLTAARERRVAWPLIAAVIVAVSLSIALGWWLQRKVLPADGRSANKE
jgi:uncharacterized membrane protein YdjX (TVP38/TMEM64 family)